MEQVQKISSVHNEKVKYFSSLLDKKTRNQEKLFLIEGYHLVEEASKTPFLQGVIGTNEMEVKQFNQVEKYVVTSAIIHKLSTTKTPQNILGIVKMWDHSSNLLQPIFAKGTVKIVMLDKINDPGNLGTIIRTTAALGYDALIMSEDSVDLYNEKVIRSTQGVLFKLPIIQGKLKEIISLCKSHKIKCIGTSLKDAKELKELTLPKTFALCFGNEANGISEEILALMDENIKITMKNDVESLNVSVASSIIMYECMK